MKNLLLLSILGLSFFIFSGCNKEDKDLDNLKSIMAMEYSPSMTKTENGNITSYNISDENMEKGLHIIESSKSPEVSKWLKENISKYNGKYLFAYAYRMALEQVPLEEYWFWRTAAVYKAASDAALCRDKYVGQYLGVLLMEYIQPADGKYVEAARYDLGKNKREMLSILNKVEEWAENNSSDNSPAWFCGSGHAVSSGDAYASSEWPSRRAAFKKEFFEKAKESYSAQGLNKKFIEKAKSDLSLVALSRRQHYLLNDKNFGDSYDDIKFYDMYEKLNSDNTPVTGKVWDMSEYKITLIDDNDGKWLAVLEISVPGKRAVISTNLEGDYCCDDIDKGICALGGIIKKCSESGFALSNLGQYI